MAKSLPVRDDFRKRLTIQLGVAVFLCIMFGIGAYLLVGRISAAGALIKQEAQKKAIKEQSIEALATLRSEAARAAPISETLKAKLPPRDAVFNVAKRVQEIAAGAGVKTTFAFGVETPGTSETAARVNFEMSVTGSLAQARQFMHALETSEYLVTIGSVDWSNGSARVNGSIYYQPPKEQ
jgi:Tfp pilus assembly protein PilO